MTRLTATQGQCQPCSPHLHDEVTARAPVGIARAAFTMAVSGHDDKQRIQQCAHSLNAWSRTTASLAARGDVGGLLNHTMPRPEGGYGHWTTVMLGACNSKERTVIQL